MKAEQYWRAVLGELELQMSQASFDTWLRDTSLIAFEDNVFVVGGFPNNDWVTGYQFINHDNYVYKLI